MQFHFCLQQLTDKIKDHLGIGFKYSATKWKKDNVIRR
jgi:hypothetical protein